MHVSFHLKQGCLTSVAPILYTIPSLWLTPLWQIRMCGEYLGKKRLILNVILNLVKIRLSSGISVGKGLCSKRRIYTNTICKICITIAHIFLLLSWYFSLFIDESKLSMEIYKHLGITEDNMSDECRVTLRPYEDIASAVNELATSCPGKIWVRLPAIP